jgi:glutamate formiminotransferase
MVQVSMNLLDLRRTPLHVVFERVRHEAEQQGVAVLESELVGLLPADALVLLGREYLRFGRLDASSVLETRLLEAALTSEQ